MTREERKLYMQEYRKTQKWKESKKKSDLKYYKNNKTYFKQKANEWKNKNLEKFYDLNKEWVKNNPQKIKEAQKQYRNKNPHYKIRNLFHNLKKNKYKDIVKPEFINIKKHIESQFINNMNWNNIEIDHKIPISWFKKETPSYLINDLRNLHPLSFKDNRKKAATYCHPISFDYFNDILSYINEERIKKIKKTLFL